MNDFNRYLTFVCFQFVFQTIQIAANRTVTSTLIFFPTPEDDGTILKCEGSNPRLPNSALEDSMILNVICKSSSNKSIIY